MLTLEHKKRRVMKKFILVLLVNLFCLTSFAGEKVMKSETYENGQKKYEVISLNEGEHYKHVSFYENGKINMVGYFNASGERDLTWKVFDMEGNLAMQFSYIDGKKTGTWVQYDDSGRLLVSKEYKNDKLKEGWKWCEDRGLIACE